MKYVIPNEAGRQVSDYVLTDLLNVDPKKVLGIPAVGGITLDGSTPEHIVMTVTVQKVLTKTEYAKIIDLWRGEKSTRW